MRAPAALGIALALALASAAVPALAQSKAEALVREGFELIGEQRFASAVKKLEKALKSGDDNAFDAHYGIAVACNGLGEFDKAVEHAGRAAELAASAEQSLYANNQLGRASFNQILAGMREEIAGGGAFRGGSTETALTKRDWSVAEGAFRRVLEIDPRRFPVARLSLAQVLAHERRYEEALAELSAWESTKPPPPPAHVQKAIDDLRCQAEASFQNPDRRLLEVGPEHPGVLAPQKLSAPAPAYTETALKERTQGLVAFEAVIDRHGDVICAQVLTGLPHGLTESAEESIRAWKFEPATVDGEPVAVVYYLTVSFRLSKIRKIEDLVPGS